jgi:AraC-like DNA-binding protein
MIAVRTSASSGANRSLSASVFDGATWPSEMLGAGELCRSSVPCVTQSYVERAPRADLVAIVRTVWVQRTGESAYVQRHLPTGGMELHFPMAGRARVVGPLTGPRIEVIPAHTTLVGVRFHPGAAAAAFPTLRGDLADTTVDLDYLWGAAVDRLAEEMSTAREPEAALDLLQAYLERVVRRAGGMDPLVREAVRHLMPWHPVEISSLATHLAISGSQLRRRCLDAVGVGPKVLQRTLRFQGFVALAQAGVTPSGRRGADGTAGLAVDAGYADQAHLSRECLRLTGLTPGQLLGGDVERCGCGHDHSASYRPFLATRPPPSWRG